MCHPKTPRIPKPAPPHVPRRPLPPPPSDQVTLTQYSRHRRTSLLPLAPAPKRPCPTPQYCSLLQRRASQSAPPQFGSFLPAQAPLQLPQTSARRSNFQLFGQCARASLTHRALFQMASKWLAKTKYGAKPKPKATAPLPSPSPSPSRQCGSVQLGFRQIFGGSTAPKYLTDGVPSNIWGLYTPKIFHGRGSVKYLGGLQPPNI